MGSLGSSTPKILCDYFLFSLLLQILCWILDALQLFGRDMIWRQRVVSTILLATFTLLPILAPFCNKKPILSRKQCHCQFSSQQLFFLGSDQISQKWRNTSQKDMLIFFTKQAAVLSWGYAVAQKLNSLCFHDYVKKASL